MHAHEQAEDFTRQEKILKLISTELTAQDVMPPRTGLAPSSQNQGGSTMVRVLQSMKSLACIRNVDKTKDRAKCKFFLTFHDLNN